MGAREPRPRNDPSTYIIICKICASVSGHISALRTPLDNQTTPLPVKGSAYTDNTISSQFGAEKRAIFIYQSLKKENEVAGTTRTAPPSFFPAPSPAREKRERPKRGRHIGSLVETALTERTNLAEKMRERTQGSASQRMAARISRRDQRRTEEGAVRGCVPVSDGEYLKFKMKIKLTCRAPRRARRTSASSWPGSS